MMWNDSAIPAAFMELGVEREDAFNYVPVGCNELAVPGQLYYNPGAHCGYLHAIEAALTGGKGHRKQWGWRGVAPPVSKLKTFDQFAAAAGAYLRKAMEKNYQWQMRVVEAQIRWGKTPLTSCFFDGCVEEGHDMADGTKYNVLLAAIREVVYEEQQATLDEVARACAANFDGHSLGHLVSGTCCK